jgi:hypothetical protein
MAGFSDHIVRNQQYSSRSRPGKTDPSLFAQETASPDSHLVVGRGPLARQNSPGGDDWRPGGSRSAPNGCNAYCSTDDLGSRTRKWRKDSGICRTAEGTKQRSPPYASSPSVIQWWTSTGGSAMLGAPLSYSPRSVGEDLRGISLSRNNIAISNGSRLRRG